MTQPYAYSRVPAFNPNTNPASVAKSATGSVYDLGDTGFLTPLNLTLVATNTVTTSLISDANGMFPDFTLVDRTQCVFKAGTQAFVLTTTTPIPGPTGPASTVPGPAGPATTDASLLAAGTVADARLPTRLGDAALSATILDLAAPKQKAWQHFSLTNRAATRAILCAQDNAAVYDSVSNRTFLSYLGGDRELMVMYYDHATQTASEAFRLASYAYAIEDDHGTPSMTITADGYLNIIFGSHDTAPVTARSAVPRDITGTWTVRTTGNDTLKGTYHQLASSGNDVYALFRVWADGGTGGHKGTSSTLSAYPAHEFADLCKSTDGMATWTKVSTVVDTNAYSAPATYAAKDFYPFSFDEHQGRLHFSFNIAYGTGHDGIRGNVYHAAWDIAQGRMENAAGVDQGTALDTPVKLDACKIITRDWVNGIRQSFRPNGNIGLAWQQKNADGKVGTSVAVWDGSTWTVTDTGVLTKHLFTAGAIRGTASGWEIYAPTTPPSSTTYLHPRDEKLGYAESGSSVAIYTLTGSTLTKVGFIRQQDIAGFGNAGVVVPRKSADGLKALIMAASVEAGVLGGLSTTSLPIYGLTDQDVNPALARNNPTSPIDMQIAPYTARNLAAVTLPGTWQSIILYDALPLHIKTLTFRVLTMGTGAAGRWELSFRSEKLSRSFDSAITGDGTEGTVDARSYIVTIPIGWNRVPQWKYSGNLAQMKVDLIAFSV